MRRFAMQSAIRNPQSAIATSGFVAPSGFSVLLRLKLRALANRFHQAAAESPVKLLTMAAFVILIWVGLYVLFWQLFEHLRATPLAAVVAVPQLFNLFFAAMLVLLTFSNAVLAYGNLFSPREASFLLSTPVDPGSVVLIKFFETLLLSSTSLILLGLPLMMAVATTTRDPSLFYPLFLAFFVAFIPIPAALGLLAAWLCARYFPRTRRRVVISAAVLVLAASGLNVVRTVAAQPQQEQRWLRDFLGRMDFIETSLLPSTWVTRGIECALRREHRDALLYLAVTLANALLLSRVVIGLVRARLMPAFDRAGASQGGADRSAAPPAGGAAGCVFFYLPRRLRLIAAKDLRMFVRDPLQWSQLAILCGLMALYLLNVPRFYVNVGETSWGLLIPFLNLAAVSFMLATFTSRFVFPLPSLEGRQYWLIGLLPIRTEGVLLAKFAFAMTVTLIVGLSTIGLSVVTLELPAGWALIHLGMIVSTCVALCGLAVGIGARLPTLDQSSPARIANSLGGTINLIASVAAVVIMLTVTGLISLGAQRAGGSNVVEPTTAAVSILAMLVGCAAGFAALRTGARHLARREF